MWYWIHVSRGDPARVTHMHQLQQPWPALLLTWSPTWLSPKKSHAIPCGRPRGLGLLPAGSLPRSSPARATTRVPTPLHTSPAPTDTAATCLPLPHFAVSTSLACWILV